MVQELSDESAFVVDGRMRIVDWSRAAAELTGVPADAAVGRPCWQVIRGVDRDGRRVCSPRCAVVRAVAGGWRVVSRDLVVDFPSGRTDVTVSTVSARGSDDLLVHRLHEADTGPEAETGRVRLTARQVQIVRLLAEGVRVREIAERLGLSEPTVRNHVHGILIGLGVHSQLEAAARARELGLAGARGSGAGPASQS